MRTLWQNLNAFLAATLTSVALTSPLLAADAAQLLDELKQPDLPEWERVESDLQREWSKSGSAAMDLLLDRGRDALEQGDSRLAIEHLTALTDHAPDFAEGWNARASAFFQDGQFGPAIEDIGRTLQLNPSHYGALSGLGMILEDLGHDERAREAFRAAEAIHPHQPDIQKALQALDRKLSGQAL